jgi:phosphoglycerate dehydrogenase-like enzyme
MRVLIPDSHSGEDPNVERNILGPEFEVDFFTLDQSASIPESAWSKADAIIGYRGIRVTADSLQRLEKARIIVRAGVGFDTIDVEACGARGIPVCNVPNYGTGEVADQAIALMMALTRGVVAYNEALKKDLGAGWNWTIGAPTMRRLRGSVFGVVGMGRIGTAAGMRAKGFGMDVVFYDPYVPSGQDIALGFRRVHSLHEVMAAADVLSIHTPLTTETRGMIDAAALAAMKPDAILINTSRGPVVDFDALYQGLRAGRIAAAGLDVLPIEPPNPDHPLLQAWRADADWIKGRFVLNPHAAFYSKGALRDMRTFAAETVRNYLLDGRLRDCVNLQYLRRNSPG